MNPRSRAHRALLLVALLSILKISFALNGTTIGPYTFRTDVTEHSEIDLDQRELEEELDEATPDYSGAETIYQAGANSEKSSSKRTLRGFSTEAGTKLRGEGFYELFVDFYGSDTYADNFVQGALKGTGRFSGTEDKFRSQCAKKGSQYQNVWMYIIHEMEDAINDCEAGTPTENDDPAVEAWDEAVAFYTGSIVLADDDSQGASGTLIYTLAQKRAVNFDTVEGSTGSSITNNEVLRLFTQGQQQLRNRACQEAVQTKNEIVQLMTIPVVQSIMRYIVLGKTTQNVNSHGEGWAFVRAVQPLIANCDQGVSKTLEENFKPELESPMPGSVEDVSRQLQSVYNCLGFRCEDVGRYQSSEGELPTAQCIDSGESVKVIEGTTRPSKQNAAATTDGSAGENDGGVSGGTIAGIVIGVLVVGAMAVLASVWLRRRRTVKAAGFMSSADMPVDA